MARTTYTPRYGAHLRSLVREDRTAEQLSREHEPCAATNRSWGRAEVDTTLRKEKDLR